MIFFYRRFFCRLFYAFLGSEMNSNIIKSFRSVKYILSTFLNQFYNVEGSKFPLWEPFRETIWYCLYIFSTYFRNETNKYHVLFFTGFNHRGERIFLLWRHRHRFCRALAVSVPRQCLTWWTSLQSFCCVLDIS